MKRYLIVAAGMVPLLAIIIFYSSLTGPSTPPQRVSRGDNVTPVAMADDARPAQTVPHSRADDVAKRIQAIGAESDRLAKAFAKKVTPKLKAEILERKMHKLESIYAPVFAKWDIDSDTKTRVLDLVRDRETRIVEIHGDGFRGGTHGLAESTRAVRSLRELYMTEFLAVLGAERAAELSALDTAAYPDRLPPRAQPD